MKKNYFIIGLLFSMQVFGSYSKNSSRDQLTKLVEKVSKMTNVQYIYPSDLRGNIGFSKNFKLTKNNADKTLSYILSVNGYTRIDTEDGYKKIISARDVRYTPIILFKADKNNYPSIPQIDDYYMMKYTFKNKLITTDIVRSFRPFMSRYGRIIDLPFAGQIIIQDTGKNIKRLYNLLSSLDVELSDEHKKRLKEDKSFRRKIKLEKAKNCPDKN